MTVSCSSTAASTAAAVEVLRVPRLIALTGGPGAGKTAVLEILRLELRGHVEVLPEAAAIVYGGGFPRRKDGPGRRAGQRAIYHVERELERMAVEEQRASIALCDRGTVDGLAYWPDSPESYWAELGTTLAAELGRYAAVIHLRTPGGHLYTRSPIRIESAEEALAIDERIALAWRAHPRRFTVAASDDFLDKVERVLALVRAELPRAASRVD